MPTHRKTRKALAVAILSLAWISWLLSITVACRAPLVRVGATGGFSAELSDGSIWIMLLDSDRPSLGQVSDQDYFLAVGFALNQYAELSWSDKATTRCRGWNAIPTITDHGLFTCVQLPLWIIFVGSSGVLWCMFHNAIRSRRANTCKCGYSLSGLPDNRPCPECGGGRVASKAVTPGTEVVPTNSVVPERPTLPKQP